jgi:hypothetical protein
MARPSPATNRHLFLLLAGGSPRASAYRFVTRFDDPESINAPLMSSNRYTAANPHTTDRVKILTGVHQRLFHSPVPGKTCQSREEDSLNGFCSATVSSLSCTRLAASACRLGGQGCACRWEQVTVHRPSLFGTAQFVGCDRPAAAVTTPVCCLSLLCATLAIWCVVLLAFHRSLMNKSTARLST